MKPRIRRSSRFAGTLFAGAWECVSDSHIAYGRTPAMAYDNWLEICQIFGDSL